MAKEHRAAILAGLALVGVGAAIRQALTASAGMTSEVGVSAIAQQALEHNVTTGDLSSALNDLHNAAAGYKDFTPLTQIGEKLQTVLESADQIANSVAGTTLQRVRQAITDGVMNGSGYKDISTAVSDITDNYPRADMIAITESNRAYNAAFGDQLAAQGQTEFYWQTDGDPCPECEDMEGNHDLSEIDQIPLHPNCQCVALDANEGAQSVAA